MFDTNNASWMKRGRWFEFYITSGRSYKLEKDPLGCDLMKSGLVKLPAGYRVMSIITDINSTSASDKCVDMRLFDDGIQGFSLPAKAAFSDMTVWVLAYKR